MPRRLRRILRSGTFSSGMFTDERAVPVAKSTTEGIPIPTASAGSTSPIASSSCSTRASGDDSSVGRRRGSPNLPSSRTATTTFVPPTSTPTSLVTPGNLSQSARAYRPSRVSGVDDAELVRRLRARDEEVFAELVERWSPSMLRLARPHAPRQAAARARPRAQRGGVRGGRPGGLAGGPSGDRPLRGPLVAEDLGLPHPGQP